MHERRGTRSSTTALHDVFLAGSKELEQAATTLCYPQDEPFGVVAVISGRAVCADIFDRPATLRAYWSSLVRSMRLRPISSVRLRRRTWSQDHFRRRLCAWRLRAPARPVEPSHRAASAATCGSMGNEVVGAALLHQGTAVHVALFPRAGDRPDAPSVASPRAHRLRKGSTR